MNPQRARELSRMTKPQLINLIRPGWIGGVPLEQWTRDELLNEALLLDAGA